MNEKLRKGLVFGILIAALIWAYFNFSDGRKKKAAKPKKAPPAQVERNNRQDSPADGKQADSLYDALQFRPWGQDPFYRGYNPASEPYMSRKVQLHLLGVVVREQAAHALINGRIVEIGDELEGYRVTGITRDSVILNNGTTTITLRVTKEST